MSRDPGAGLRGLVHRVLDGIEIEWDRELRRNPEAAEAIQALREVEHLARAHRRATLVTTARGVSGAGGGSPLAEWGVLRILEKIGEGSAGEVFRAYDPRLQTEVALKLFHSAHPGMAESLLAEARSLARVRHPNVLQVYGADDHGGRVGMWSELLRGRTLEELATSQGWFGPREATIIGIDLCRALAAVHGASLVHGDVKTSNVMRALGGRIILMDFGTAALPEDTDPAVGTPITMAPEQLRGEPGTRSADLYALGVLLYRLVTGRYPIEAGSIEALRTAHRAAAMIPLRDRRPDLPAAFVQVIERAMAPRPEERYSSAGEMERALVASLTQESGWEPGVDPSEPPSSTGDAPAAVPSAPRPGWFVRSRLLAMASFTVALLGLIAIILVARPKPQGWLPGVRTHQPTSGKKDWILVAEFEGPPGEAGLATGVRDLLSAALDQSGIVATVPRDDLRTALARAGKPDSMRVDARVAREIAYRSSVRAVLDGSVHRLGEGYAVVLRVVDVDDGKVLLTVSEVAERRKDLVAAIERVAHQLREGLGERRGAIRASRPLLQAMTPSFEAYRKFAEAYDRLMIWDFRSSVALYREAIALDPDFAAAWGWLSFPLWNLGEGDSARAAVREALRRPGRLDDPMRLQFEATQYIFQGDPSAALATYDRLLQLDPSNIAGHNNRGLALREMGRYEDAFASFNRAASLSPLEPPQLILRNQVDALLALGQIERARQVARGLLAGNEPGRKAPISIALDADEWSTADSLGTALEDDPGVSAALRAFGAEAVASAQTARGAAGAAVQALARAQLGSGLSAYRDLLLVSIVTGRPVTIPGGRGSPGATINSVVPWAYRAAAAGRATEVRQLLHTIRSHHGERETEGSTDDLELLETWVAAREGRWSDALQIARPAMREVINTAGNSGLRAQRCWLVADAYEHLGRRDSAALYLEAATSPRVWLDLGAIERGIVYSFAHQRMASLYAAIGRVDDARRHWEIFLDTFTQPDEALRPLVDSARVALNRVGQTPASARRR